MKNIFSQGVMLNTLVHDHYIHKGSQWAILNRTHQYGPLITDEDRKRIAKGIMLEPMCMLGIEGPIT